MICLSFNFLWFLAGAASPPRRSGSSLDRNGLQIGDDRVDLIGLEIVLPARHAWRSVGDERAHHLLIAASGVLVERRAVGSSAEPGRQMAHPARLSEHFAPHLLLFCKIAGLLRKSALRRDGEHE